jgi:hypothetical protein
MSRFILELPFKGSRDYLHSTNIFSALEKIGEDRFESGAFIRSLMLRRPMRRAILAVFERPADAAGSFVIQTRTEQVTGWLVESGLPVSRRVPFDSSPLSAMAVVGDGMVLVRSAVAGHTLIDVVVGLMKKLTEQLPVAAGSGQWWLCQLDLEMPLREVYPIEVRIRRVVGDQRLLVDLVQGGERVGSARFIWAEGVREDSASQTG